jgi:hypothetical protein
MEDGYPLNPFNRPWLSQQLEQPQAFKQPLLTSEMTLRDYFAAKAMHQILHGAVVPVGYDATEEFKVVSQRAYEIADAMMKERNQE